MNSPPFSSLAVAVFLVTMCWWVIVLLPAIMLCGRYFYSSQVIQGYLEKAISRDMGNIEEFYTKSSGKYARVELLSGDIDDLESAVAYGSFVRQADEFQYVLRRLAWH